MYTIEQLSCITGLTTRTLRNYLKSNILQGSKDSGMWHFTEEQVSDFIYHPAVYPSIQAKHHAIVYDFLAGQDNGENEICVLLDLKLDRGKAQQTADFFLQCCQYALPHPFCLFLQIRQGSLYSQGHRRRDPPDHAGILQ